MEVHDLAMADWLCIKAITLGYEHNHEGLGWRAFSAACKPSMIMVQKQ